MGQHGRDRQRRAFQEAVQLAAEVRLPDKQVISATLADKEGKTVVRRMTGQDFINAVGRGGEAWNESIAKPEVRQDGDLATVWGYFTFRLGDKPSHCGYDQFTLARLDGEWKMISAADTHQKKEDCKF